MASSFSVSGTNTTVVFSFIAPTTTIQNIVGNASEYLWEHGYGDHGTPEEPIVYSSLTNTQKLSLVENHVKQVILDLSNTYKSIKAQEAARTTEEENKYNI